MKTEVGQGGLVYSTDSGRMCPACRKAVALCDCARPAPARTADGTVRVARQTKGRAGKAVTLITGLTLEHAELTALCKQLKSSCGAGGTVKDGVIEIQGDHRDAVITSLQKQGWTFKRSGD